MLMAILISWGAFAAVPSERGPSEYLAPTETLTVLKGRVSLCTLESPQGGRRGLSFIQLGKGPCPQAVRTPVGWDRPEEEPVSPGIPFRGRGL